MRYITRSFYCASARAQPTTGQRRPRRDWSARAVVGRLVFCMGSGWRVRILVRILYLFPSDEIPVRLGWVTPSRQPTSSISKRIFFPSYPPPSRAGSKSSSPRRSRFSRRARRPMSQCPSRTLSCGLRSKFLGLRIDTSHSLRVYATSISKRTSWRHAQANGMSPC
jgi:hypothetical protein